MDDLISRQAAIDTLKMDISIIPFAKAREYVREAIETIYNRLEDLPSAQTERKTGKWLTQQFGSWVECSECHELYDIPIAQSNFCPNCGSDNRGEQYEYSN